MTMAEYMAHEQRILSGRRGFIPQDQELEVIERDLHSKIKEECRRRGWICFTGSMAHRAMRTIGEPDFTILADNGRVLFIEAKSKLGKLRPEQAALQAWAKKLNHDIKIVRSMDEFLEVVKL